MASRKPDPPSTGTKGGTGGSGASSSGKSGFAASGATTRVTGLVTEVDVDAAEAAVDARDIMLATVTLRRPDDMLVAEATFYNMKLDSGSPRRLVRTDASRDATLVIELPPQSFAEEAYLDATGPEVASTIPGEFPDSNPDSRPENEPKNEARGGAETTPLPVETRLRIAKPSRLAFTMPAGVTSIPYTVEGVLQACRSWPPRRALAAQPEPTLPPGVNLGGGMGSTTGAMGGASNDLTWNALSFGAFVASDDFLGVQRRYLDTVESIGGPAARAAVIAAGKRIATKAMTTSATDATRTRALVDDAARVEVDTIVRSGTGFATTAGRAALTMAVGHAAVGAIAEAAGMGVGATTGGPKAELVPDLSLLAQMLKPQRPTNRVTAIEMPYRLVISPIGPARWVHRTTAVARQGRNELWHTRLTTGMGDAGPDIPGKVRAIWSEDYPRESFAITNGIPFRASLDAQDRKMLVQLTSGFDETTVSIVGGIQNYLPTPARAQRLILSPLGALLDANGSWNTRPPGVDLTGWKHLATMGRDHYVRVVYAGYLLPFGHAASLIKITERKFEFTERNTKLTKRVAVLRQRFFIVVREPVKQFDGSYHRTGGHPFPFTSVEILSRVTPQLMAPDDAACVVAEAGGPLYDKAGVTGGLTPRQLFWPKIAGPPIADFMFDLAAIDRDGRRTTFSLPLLFVSDKANAGTVTKGGSATRLIDNLVAAYNGTVASRRSTHTGGASICFAPPSGDDVAGDPHLPTESLRFKISRASFDSPYRLNAYPECEEARVALRAVQRVLGKSDATVNVRYAGVYAEQGFGGGNPGELFIELVSPPVNMTFGPGASASRSDVVGAVASPAMTIRGISRRIGLASDIDKVRTSDFDPATFFGDAKILGGIRLASVVARTSSLSRAPRFTTSELPANGNQPARTVAVYDWITALAGPDPSNLLLPSANGSSDSPVRMSTVVSTPVDAPNSATSTATATIGNFKVNLFTFVVLWFRELRFAAERGRKPEVNVDLHPTRAVEFGGPLQFVNRLKELLPGDGFSDPSALTTTPSGIAAHYTLTVPSVQVGVFAISGLSVGARFALPFDNSPVEVGFEFGTRENPFSLTVSLLGGGGFLVIGIGADGVREIEAAVEAQARLAIDLGVASGSVEIAAGIYFHWLTGSGGIGGAVQLAGYVRVHGELDVMAIISVSLTFNLTLCYEKRDSGPVIWGEASVIVEIEVLVFSGEVTVRCRREFKGTPGDPTFKDLMPGDNTWSAYCSSFAA